MTTRADAATETLTLDLGDVTYRIPIADMTPRDALDFRRLIGLRLLSVFTDQADLDSYAVVLWLWRRKREPDLPFEDVWDTFTYGDLNFDTGNGEGGG